MKTASFGFRRFLPGYVAAFFLFPCAAYAQPTITGVSPAGGSHNNPIGAGPSAAFSETMAAPDERGFALHRGSGRRSGAPSGGGSATLSFTPASDFFPGEEIEVSLTRRLKSQGGMELSSPYVWRWRAAAARGPARRVGDARSLCAAAAQQVGHGAVSYLLWHFYLRFTIALLTRMAV